MELLSGLYSEVGETDFIEEFKETDQFADHIAVTFGGEERAPWDQAGRYTSTYIVLYRYIIHTVLGISHNLLQGQVCCPGLCSPRLDTVQLSPARGSY